MCIWSVLGMIYEAEAPIIMIIEEKSREKLKLFRKYTPYLVKAILRSEQLSSDKRFSVDRFMFSGCRTFYFIKLEEID